MTNFVNAQTSVPYWLMVDFHRESVVRYGRLNKMYIHMLQGFLAYEPWKSTPPLPWRAAKVHGSTGPKVRQGSDPGWVPMNMLLPNDLVERIKHTIDMINLSESAPDKKLSLRSFLYTAVCWWYLDVLQCKGAGVIDS
jgi:hypothetical protein